MHNFLSAWPFLSFSTTIHYQCPHLSHWPLWHRQSLGLHARSTFRIDELIDSFLRHLTLCMTWLLACMQDLLFLALITTASSYYCGDVRTYMIYTLSRIKLSHFCFTITLANVVRFQPFFHFCT